MNKRIRPNRYKKNKRGQSSNPLPGFKTAVKCFLGLLVLTTLSMALIFCYDFVTQSAWFAADKIEVIGCERTTETQIRQAANLSLGINILGINLKIVRQKLLMNPWVANAEIQRKLPSEILIVIEEHHPLAILSLGRQFLIDTEGQIFKECQTSDPTDLPVINGLEYSDLNPKGAPKSEPYAAVLDLLHLSQGFGKNGVAFEIKKIDVDREIGLTLHVANQRQIIQLGYQHYMQKYTKLKNVMAYLEKEHTLSKVHSIDLKNLDRIVIKLMDINEAAGKQKEV